MRNLIIFLSTIVLVILLSGCKGSIVETGWTSERNRSNMLKLNVGMNKDQVLELMGKPYKTESYPKKGKMLDIWLYLTEGKSFMYDRLMDSNFTPLALENDILVGWGRSYYENVIRIQQDIKIENR